MNEPLLNTLRPLEETEQEDLEEGHNNEPEAGDSSRCDHQQNFSFPVSSAKLFTILLSLKSFIYSLELGGILKPKFCSKKL